jgi:hypothetical protein
MRNNSIKVKHNQNLLNHTELFEWEDTLGAMMIRRSEEKAENCSWERIEVQPVFINWGLTGDSKSWLKPLFFQVQKYIRVVTEKYKDTVAFIIMRQSYIKILSSPRIKNMVRKTSGWTYSKADRTCIWQKKGREQTLSSNRHKKWCLTSKVGKS